MLKKFLQKNRYVIMTTAFTIVHLIITIVTLMMDFGKVMKQFDNRYHEITLSEKILGAFSKILGQPFLEIVPVLETFKNIPEIVYYLLFLLNSLLWGLILMLLIRMINYLSQFK